MSASSHIGLASREVSPDLAGLVASLEEVKDLELDVVELPAYALDLVIGGRLLENRVRELEQACRDRGLGFTIHGPLAVNFMGPADHLPRFLDATKAFVEIAARIKAPHLVVHAGMILPAERPEYGARLMRQRDWLARAGDFAATHGVTLCIENLFDFSGYCGTPSMTELAREIDAIAHSHVRATFDFSHGFIHAAQHGLDFLSEAEALAPHAVHLHLHDSFGVPDLPWVYAAAEANAVGMGDLHLPVGWGTVPWEQLARRCRFPASTIAIHELATRFWRERHEALAAARRVAASFRRG
jgi:sugar phosphate isomerase/epimerase